MKRAIIFDSGTLISFAMNGLFEELRGLKQIFRGNFLITEDVKREIIDKPIKIKRFELEALRLKKLVDEKVLELPSDVGLNQGEILKRGTEIMKAANELFQSEKQGIHLIDIGEASCLAISEILTKQGVKNVIAVDERTIRMLTENPDGLKNFLQKKMHTKIYSKKGDFSLFKSFRFIRSAELLYVAFKKGVVKLKGDAVLDALLYAVKFKGCSISNEEINEIKKIK